MPKKKKKYRPIGTTIHVQLKLANVRKKCTWSDCTMVLRVRGQGKLIFPVQLTTSRIGNHTRLMPSLLKVMTTHTHKLGEMGRSADQM